LVVIKKKLVEMDLVNSQVYVIARFPQGPLVGP